MDKTILIRSLSFFPIVLFLLTSCADPVEPPQEYTVTSSVTPQESGRVVVEPRKDFYQKGEQVTIMARPNDGYHFSHWSGDLEGTTGTKVIAVEVDLSVTAEFQSVFR